MRGEFESGIRSIKGEEALRGALEACLFVGRGITLGSCCLEGRQCCTSEKDRGYSSMGTTNKRSPDSLFIGP